MSPEVNSSKTGINFKIAPGALVQDLTYFEFQKETVVSVDDIADLSEYYIIIYTSWRYLETVYENPMKFEATLYNPRTKNALSPWNPATNRIILGVYSFISSNGIITEVNEEDLTIFFSSSNIIRNGFFDNETTDYWTPINSRISISRDYDGIMDSQYVVATPQSGSYQGIAQVIQTKINTTYDVSFYVRSDESVAVEAAVYDKSSLFSMSSADLVESYKSTSTKKWTLHTFRFTAFSNQSTIFLLKRSDSLDNTIYFDHVCVFEYILTRRHSSLHKVSMIDGGYIPTTEDLVPERVMEDYVHSWAFPSKPNVSEYRVDSTCPHLKNPSSGFYFIFYNGSKILENDYYIDWKNNKIKFNIPFSNQGKEISVLFIRNPGTSNCRWKIEVSGNATSYAADSTQENFQDPENGQYLVFYNGNKLDESKYSVNPASNLIQFSSGIFRNAEHDFVEIYYIADPIDRKTWFFNSVSGSASYSLPSDAEPFVDESKGKYAVFVDGKRISDEDKIIRPSSGSLVLASAPQQSGLPIRVYYYGNAEDVDETPIDQNDDVYKWEFIANPNQTAYLLHESVDHLRDKSQGYYLAFKNGNHINPSKFDVVSTLGKVSFSSGELAAGDFAELYFIKKPSNQKYSWTFTASAANARNYSPASPASALCSPDDGTYMIFVNNKKLSKNEYTVNYTQNKLVLANSVQIAKNDIIEVIFITNPTTYDFWEFDTVSNIKTYIPKETETSFSEVPDGEFIFFSGGRKLTDDEFKINKLRNNLSFITAPQSNGIKCELYFVGKE